MRTTESPENEWQRIWFSIRQQRWTSLALVPGQGGVDVATVADKLAATVRLHGEHPVTVVNATRIQIGNVQQTIDSITTATTRGDYVLIAVDPIDENPSAIGIVQAASAALLVLRLGESRLTAAQGTIDAIGRDRFLGSIVVDDAANAALLK